MGNIIVVNIINWHANHGENSNDIVLWKERFWEFVNDFFERLIVLFYDNAKRTISIFDNINYLAYHRVVL
jgi:hypothetical protein